MLMPLDLLLIINLNVFIGLDRLHIFVLLSMNVKFVDLFRLVHHVISFYLLSHVLYKIKEAVSLTH